MIIYICLLCAIVLSGLSLLDKHYLKYTKKFFLFFSLFSMMLVLGLRARDVGEDTQHYLDIFKYAQVIPFKDILSHFRIGYYTDQFGFTDTIECGFLLICRLIGVFTQNEQIYLLILSIITFCLIGRFIKDNTNNYFMAIYIVLCDYFFMYSFNGIRQLIAVAVAIQSYSLLKKKRYLSAALIIALAAYIHNSALICYGYFSIIFVKNQKTYKTFKIASIIAFSIPALIFIMKSIIVHILPRYEAYFYNNYWKITIGGSVILYLFEVVIILYIYKKQFFGDDELYVLSLFVLIYISFELAGLQISALARMSHYFRIFIIIYMPQVFLRIKAKNRVYIKFSFVILLFLLYLSYASIPSRNYHFLL